MYKWEDEDGDIIGAAWNDEYTLFVDFADGIRIDDSPNFLDAKRGESPGPDKDSWFEFDELVEKWGLSTEEDDSDWLRRELSGDMSFKALQTLINESWKQRYEE